MSKRTIIILALVVSVLSGCATKKSETQTPVSRQIQDEMKKKGYAVAVTIGDIDKNGKQDVIVKNEGENPDDDVMKDASYLIHTLAPTYDLGVVYSDEIYYIAKISDINRCVESGGNDDCLSPIWKIKND